MSEWKLCGTENPRTGEVHTWIRRDGESVDLEDVVDELNRLNLTCEARGKLIEGMEAEVERLLSDFQAAMANVNLWLVLGEHRNCPCLACEGLRQIWLKWQGEEEDEPQPDYCDCDGFHTGMCRERHVEKLEAALSAAQLQVEEARMERDHAQAEAERARVQRDEVVARLE